MLAIGRRRTVYGVVESEVCSLVEDNLGIHGPRGEKVVDKLVVKMRERPEKHCADERRAAKASAICIEPRAALAR